MLRRVAQLEKLKVDFTSHQRVAVPPTFLPLANQDVHFLNHLLKRFLQFAEVSVLKILVKCQIPVR